MTVSSIGTILDLDALTSLGLQPSFVDAFGVERTVGTRTVERVAAAFAASPQPTPDTLPLVLVPGTADHELVGELTCEDGTSVRLEGWLPADVPLGYHRLSGTVARDRLVVVVPPAHRTPAPGWGFAVQLYAARRPTSWGIGDFGDLAHIARRVRSEGATTLLVSPLHAGRPGPCQTDSPYSPASRLFLNVNHIDCDRLPGLSAEDVADLALAAQALGPGLIDRTTIHRLKVTALERAFEGDLWDGDGFERFCGAQGEDLRLFAVWSVLAETFGGPWWEWPVDVRRPDAAGVARFAIEHADRVRFWMFCQWVADVQFAEACDQGVDVVSDLAVGFDAGGFDGWIYQDLLAPGFEIGCPADRGNPDGQRWGVVPFDPAKLAAAEYRPHVAMFRSNLRWAQGVRVDHVMGLWRLYWVPSDGTAADGCYIRYHGDALAGILRLEAERAGAWVVGEDMGTIEEHAAGVMAMTRMLSYRVSMRTHPDLFPDTAMVACQTHDQPTVSGVLDRSDVAECHRVGKLVDIEAVGRLRDRIAGLASIDPTVTPDRSMIDDAIVAMYDELAASRSLVTLITFEDLAGCSVRPNIPGIVDRPNWRMPLPVTVDELFESPLARRVLATVSAHRRPMASPRSA